MMPAALYSASARLPWPYEMPAVWVSRSRIVMARFAGTTP